MFQDLTPLLGRLLPETMEPFLARALGSSIPRDGEGDRYGIICCGQFRGAFTADLLGFAKTHKLSTALLVTEGDAERALLFHEGVVVGSHSNVLFERVGRILHKAGVLDKEDGNAVVDCEEKMGIHRAMQMVSQEAASWGLEKRAWEVGAALYFVRQGHFVFVEGAPQLEKLPRLDIRPMQLAMEGMRRYDEWRHGKGRTPSATTPVEEGATHRLPQERARPLPPVPAAPSRSAAELEADAIMKMLKEGE